MKDAIVVGSGASAVFAARALVQRGLSVLMLDVGHRDETYAPLIPDTTWTQARRTDPAQHRYFLGDRFEGIAVGDVRVGAQLTPPRAHVGRGTAELTPLRGEGFATLESLAAGGLAAGWGAGVTRFSDDDLRGSPIGAADLLPHYRAAEEEIGVCGERDDLSEDLGDHEPMMPPLPLDTGTAILYERYRRDRERLHALGLRMGAARLAACSQAKGDRGPHPLDDLDFWADKRRAVWRPQWTLQALQRREGFAYLPGRLALRFQERAGRVALTARDLATGAEETHEARALVLAAGVLGSARIVLRSAGAYGTPLPLACNPYTYAVFLNTAMLGKEPGDARHSLAQLLATQRVPGDPQVYAAIYSYRSLLTFKLIKESPLAARLALQLMPALIPLLAIAGVQHADEPSASKHVMLSRGQGDAPDVLHVRYALSALERQRVDRGEAAFLRAFRALGCLPLRTSQREHGSSIHLGGTLPMRREPSSFECDARGLLHGTERVVVADGSLLPRLPAKGLTLTLMANAHRVGTRLAETL